MHELRPLLNGLTPRVVGTLPETISAIVADSRRVARDDLFVALRGEHVDGHAYAATAVAQGAAALVVEHELPLDVPQIVVADTRRAISRLAAAYYGEPSHGLAVAGVTGTNGKTTTTHLLASIAAAAGRACGIIGTLGATLGLRSWPLDNTTPLALELHALLAEMRDAGATHVAMEVSSHALELGRCDDVRFAVGGLTNVTRDHLDFHVTFERYVAAKRILFDLAPSAVINLDDGVGEWFAAELPNATTYALERPAMLRAEQLELHGGGSRFRVDGQPVDLPLPGRFNVANALCAFGMARRWGIDDATIARGLDAVRPVPGRMERLGADGIDAIVDYAHTPDALQNVLRAARETTRGRLIVVFGCGGDRDAGKRAEMGRIAVAHADRAIVTSDNPRSEDPAAIARAVAGETGAEIVLDRRDAIRRAIAEATSGDTIVVAGKGHEPYQLVGGTRLPFDDRDEVRAAFALRAAKAAAPS